jgi:hypothetical protein
METGSSLLSSQEPTNRPCPESNEFSPRPHTFFFRIHLNIILHLGSRFPNVLSLSGLPTKILMPTFSVQCTSKCLEALSHL